MFVRVFAPPNHPGTTFEICNAIGAEFILTATPGPDNDAENIATAPNNNTPFEANFSQDDSDDPAPPVLLTPPGCFVGRHINLTTGPWILSVSRTTPQGNVIWNTSCEVLITSDESTTNAPWAGFSANGEEYDVVETTEGCVFEDIGIVNNLYP